MSDLPVLHTARLMLRILGEKEVVKHRTEGRVYRYRPVQPKQRAAKMVLDEKII